MRVSERVKQVPMAILLFFSPELCAMMSMISNEICKLWHTTDRGKMHSKVLVMIKRHFSSSSGKVDIYN